MGAGGRLTPYMVLLRDFCGLINGSPTLYNIDLHRFQILCKVTETLQKFAGYFSVRKQLEFSHLVNSLNFILFRLIVLNISEHRTPILVLVRLYIERLQLVVFLDLLPINYIIEVALKFRAANSILKNSAHGFPLMIDHEQFAFLVGSLVICVAVFVVFTAFEQHGYVASDGFQLFEAEQGAVETEVRAPFVDVVSVIGRQMT